LAKALDRRRRQLGGESADEKLDRLIQMEERCRAAGTAGALMEWPGLNQSQTPPLGCCNFYLDLMFPLVCWRCLSVTWEEMKLLKVCNHDGWIWRMMWTLHN
jgi:hypothetical protein